MNGPYYDNDRGELIIPDKSNNPEWERRGLLYDRERQVWWIAIAPEHAESQVAKAKAVFDRVALRDWPILYFSMSDAQRKMTVRAVSYDAARAMVQADPDCAQVIG